MIKAGQIDKGSFLYHKNAPYLVAEREFVNPGKGSAFVRLKLKNLLDGSVLKETMKSQDNVEDIEVAEKDCQYLYSDGENFHFMDNETYDQFEIPVKSMEDKALYMKDGETYRVVIWDENPIDIKIPFKVVYEVTEAAEALKGDTVTGATKVITIETGLKVKVPIFIKQGERILVNTETGEYVERVNN
ncbi:MAG: elongation factor P [Spirochaetales bacterium]|nr:elongation factor P [Spirochaetales bacterium]